MIIISISNNFIIKIELTNCDYLLFSLVLHEQVYNEFAGFCICFDPLYWAYNR